MILNVHELSTRSRFIYLAGCLALATKDAEIQKLKGEMDRAYRAWIKKK